MKGRIYHLPKIVYLYSRFDNLSVSINEFGIDCPERLSVYLSKKNFQSSEIFPSNDNVRSPY